MSTNKKYEFNFKETIWRKASLQNEEAEKALELIKQGKITNLSELSDEFEPHIEDDFETSTELSPNENGGEATVEVMDGNDMSDLYSNEKEFKHGITSVSEDLAALHNKSKELTKNPNSISVGVGIKKVLDSGLIEKLTTQNAELLAHVKELQSTIDHVTNYMKEEQNNFDEEIPGYLDLIGTLAESEELILKHEPKPRLSLFQFADRECEPLYKQGDITGMHFYIVNDPNNISKSKEDLFLRNSNGNVVCSFKKLNYPGLTTVTNEMLPSKYVLDAQKERQLAEEIGEPVQLNFTDKDGNAYYICDNDTPVVLGRDSKIVGYGAEEEFFEISNLSEKIDYISAEGSYNLKEHQKENEHIKGIKDLMSSYMSVSNEGLLANNDTFVVGKNESYNSYLLAASSANPTQLEEGITVSQRTPATVTPTFEVLYKHYLEAINYKPSSFKENITDRIDKKEFCEVASSVLNHLNDCKLIKDFDAKKVDVLSATLYDDIIKLSSEIKKSPKENQQAF